MDIKGFLEWVGHDSGSAAATVFPYLLVGLVGLYLLWLLVGYLRVSQVGIGAAGHAPAAAPLALPEPSAESGAIPRGVPYCPTDRLAFGPDARICPRCEGDLLVDCAVCGTTIPASDASCFHCGTRQPIIGE